MRDTPRTRIGPRIGVAFTSATCVLLLLAVLLFPVATAVTAAGTPAPSRP